MQKCSGRSRKCGRPRLCAIVGEKVGSKLDKAKELRVPVLTEAEFDAMLGSHNYYVNRRRKILCIVLSFVATVVGAMFLTWPRSPRINRRCALNVALGMTRADVEALLGGPARDEITRFVVDVPRPEGVETTLEDPEVDEETAWSGRAIQP